MLRKYQFDELAAIIARKCNGEGVRETDISGVRCCQSSERGVKRPAVYTPSISVIAQGHAQVTLGRGMHHYLPSQFLGVSVDVPLTGMVLEASRDKPYLCLQIDLDPAQLTDLFAHMPRDGSKLQEAPRGMFVGEMDASLIDSVLRLARLLNTPNDIHALAPLALREIYYRLLSGAHGPAITELASAGSNMQRIARVIKTMRSDISKSLSIEDLASLADMSPSSFHAHFKRITAMSPLQYYKQLRLIEARRIMRVANMDAASAAQRVGYASPSQFSREYARMFGAPPMRDMRKTGGT